MNTFDENLEINIEKPLFPNKRFHSGLRQYNKFMVDNNLIYQKNIDLKTSQITSLFNKSNEEGNMKMHNKFSKLKLVDLNIEFDNVTRLVVCNSLFIIVTSTFIVISESGCISIITKGTITKGTSKLNTFILSNFTECFEDSVAI